MLHVLLVFIIEHSWILVLVNVALGRLVWLFLQLHLRQLLCLSLSFFFGLLLGFLVGLDLSKLFEDVLVVEKGVGELFFEDVGLQELADSVLQDGLLQELVDGGPRVWVFVEHHSHKVRYLGREVAGQGIILALADPNSELMKR